MVGDSAAFLLRVSKGGQRRSDAVRFRWNRSDYQKRSWMYDTGEPDRRREIDKEWFDGREPFVCVDPGAFGIKISSQKKRLTTNPKVDDAPSLGHVFDSNLRCANHICLWTWAQQQECPLDCWNRDFNTQVANL